MAVGFCCVLCGAPNPAAFSEPEPGRRYHHCVICDLRFLDPRCRLTAEQERSHYLLHENDVEDARYQDFVRPLCEQVTRHAAPGSACLDFGCGTGPVLAHLLGQAGYQVSCYDPFFAPDPSALEVRYDCVAASEVIEHFHRPLAEFEQLRGLLRPGGFLAVMTAMVRPDTDFVRWHYRRDPTHVVFYSEASFGWIARRFGFRDYWTDGVRLAVFWAT